MVDGIVGRVLRCCWIWEDVGMGRVKMGKGWVRGGEFCWKMEKRVEMNGVMRVMLGGNDGVGWEG